MNALNYIEMTPKYSPNLHLPPKSIHKILIPKIILIFWNPPKYIEIQNFDPPKMAQAYSYMTISETPLPRV